MSRQRGVECCEYREEQRRLAARKLRKKGKERKIGGKKNDCEDDNEVVEDERKCEGKRSYRSEKLPRVITWKEETMGRIKPSIEQRDKYSMDSRHIRCFLETAAIEKFELEEKISRISRKEPCDSDDEPKIGKKRMRLMDKKVKAKDKKEELEEEPKNIGDTPGEKDESADTEEDKEMDEAKAVAGRRRKPAKGEFWCSKIRKKKEFNLKVRPSRKDDIDCENSICSFDSRIDLTDSYDSKRRRVPSIIVDKSPRTVQVRHVTSNDEIKRSFHKHVEATAHRITKEHPVLGQRVSELLCRHLRRKEMNKKLQSLSLTKQDLNEIVATRRGGMTLSTDETGEETTR